MSLRRIEKATVFPISVADATLHCRSIPDENSLMERFIATANEKIGAMAGMVLGIETWELTQVDVTGSLNIPLLPVSELVSVTSEGATLPGFTLVVDGDRSAVTGPWPAGEVVVTVKAGGNVPDALALAMLHLVAHWYWNREAVSETGMYEVPYAVEDLVSDHRRGWVMA